MNYRNDFIVSTNDDALHDTMNGTVTGKLIRCRDCKHAKKIYFKNLPCFKLWEYSCQYFNQSVIGDGYCYLAERKTDNA